MAEVLTENTLIPAVLSELAQALTQKFSAEEQAPLDSLKEVVNIFFSVYQDEILALRALEPQSMTGADAHDPDQLKLDALAQDRIQKLAQRIIADYSLVERTTVTLDTSGFCSTQQTVCSAIAGQLEAQGISAKTDFLGSSLAPVITRKMLNDEDLSQALENFLGTISAEELIAEFQNFSARQPVKDMDLARHNYYWVNLGMHGELAIGKKILEKIEAALKNVSAQQGQVQARVETVTDGESPLNEEQWRIACLGMVSNFMRALFYLVAKGETDIDKLSPPVRQKAVAAMVQVMNQ